MKQIEKFFEGFRDYELVNKINEIIENQNKIINSLTSSGLSTKEEMNNFSAKHEGQKSALDELNEMLLGDNFTIVLCDRTGVIMDDMNLLIRNAITELKDEIEKDNESARDQFSIYERLLNERDKTILELKKTKGIVQVPEMMNKY